MPSTDLDTLLTLRLIVARAGEMDACRWWNTKGQLGRLGGLTVARGLPRTHAFARARSVFAVATARSEELVGIPGHLSLWSLPVALEERFDAEWERWLEEPERWSPVFAVLESPPPNVASLVEQLCPGPASEPLPSRPGDAAGSSAALPGQFRPVASTFRQLAISFDWGSLGQPVVPYFLPRPEQP